MTIKKPPIRFKDDNGQSYPDAEQTTFGAVYTERKEKGDDSLQILSVSIHTGVSDQELAEEDLGKDVKRSKDKSVYKRAESGDLVFNMMRAWQGAVGSVTNRGMVSPAYIVAKPDGSVDPVYIDYLVQTKKAVYEFDRLSYGVTDFRKRLYWDSFVKVPLSLPSIKEQQKIAALFTELDKLISTTSDEVSALKEAKKGMMQKIFSQEVRFKKDDSTEYAEWEEMMLCDISFYNTETDIGIKSSYVGTENMLKGCAGVVFDKSDEIIKGVRYLKGDILVSNIRPYLQKAWLADREGVCSSDVLCIRPKSGINSVCLYYLLSRDVFFRHMMQAAKGSKMPRGDKEYTLAFSMSFPSDIEEQQKIVSFFSSMDSAISAAKDEMQGYKDLKKYLLQNMFA